MQLFQQTSCLCKHIIFILAATETLNYLDMGSATIHIPRLIEKLSTPTLNSLTKYELDGHTNKLCVATSRTCNCEIRNDLSICVRCFGVCHTECASVHSLDCSICFLQRHNVQVTTCKSGYRDFPLLISYFKWPLGTR